MDSSTEAFERFFKWKKFATVLNLTVDTIEHGEQQIFFVDDDEQLVAFSGLRTRDVIQLNLKGANFLVGKCLVEAARPGGVKYLLRTFYCADVASRTLLNWGARAIKIFQLGDDPKCSHG